jgi:hypothetical protein
MPMPTTPVGLPPISNLYISPLQYIRLKNTFDSEFLKEMKN